MMRNVYPLLLAVMLCAGCKQDRTTECINDIGCYWDFSTVDWAELSNRYYRPNTADWDSATSELIIDGFPMDIASGVWHLLQNARTDFHKISLPLRVDASDNIVDALDRVEASFDTVFIRCVTQEYYLRLLPEMYNETMKPAIDNLVNELTNNLTN